MRILGVLMLLGLLSGCAALPGVIASGAGVAGSMPILGHAGTGYSVLCRGYRLFKGERLDEQIRNDYDEIVEFFTGKTEVRRHDSAGSTEDVTHG